MAYLSIENEKGIALLTTVVVTAVLIILAVEFVYKVYLSTARSALFVDSERAAVLAEDGVTIGKAGIEKILKTRPNVTMGEKGVSFSQTLGEGASVEIRVVDERSKASLKVVYPATGLTNDKVEGIYSRLLESLDIDTRLTDALSDWMDADDTPRSFGAESPDYQQLQKPYKAKNNDVESVDELLMIKGYTPKVFDTLGAHVTAYTDGLININTAPKAILMALSSDMTEELAGNIIAYRAGTAFKDKSDIMKVRGFETLGFALQDKVATSSQVYRIFSKAKVNDSIREAEAVVKTGSGAGVLYWREF